MKHVTFVIVTVAIFGALSAWAQPPGGGRGRPGGSGFGGPPQGGPQGGPQPNAVLGAIDADGDHEISAQEIADSPRSLAKLDKNRDGKLTHDEIHSGGPGGGGPGSGGPGGRPTAEQFLAHAMTFDANGDGTISKAEMANMAKAVTEEMARRGGGEHGPGGAGGQGSGRPGRPNAEGGGQSRQRPEIE